MGFFKKKYDDEYEKAKIRGLKAKIGSEKLIMERKALQSKKSKLSRKNSPFVAFGKQIAKKVGKPSGKPKRNPLDDFFK